MLSGCCIAAKGIQPGIRIFAAEPMGADDAARSFASGEWVPQTNPQTCADGLLTSTGKITWPIIKDHIEDVKQKNVQKVYRIGCFEYWCR